MFGQQSDEQPGTESKEAASSNATGLVTFSWSKVRTEKHVGLKPHRAEEVGSSTAETNVPSSENVDSRMTRASPSSWPREEKLQEWEGRVLSVRGDRFTARLVDVTAGADREEEEGEFPLVEVSDDDRAILRENAIFRWVIGYRYVGATKERFGRIVFRRLPAWSAAELTAAKDRARDKAEKLVWE